MQQGCSHRRRRPLIFAGLRLLNGTQVTARYDDDHNQRELARAPGASGQRVRTRRAAPQ
jgi:hypothetical protein